MVFAADYQKLTGPAFVTKNGKHIYVHHELILVQIDIVFEKYGKGGCRDGVVETFFFLIKSHSKTIAIFMWEIVSFEKVKKRVAEAARVVVLTINDCLFIG